jgi:hypothetical protein
MTIATVRTEISNRKPFPHVTRASARPVPTVGQSSGGGTVMAEAGGGGGGLGLQGGRLMRRWWARLVLGFQIIGVG